jgi:Curlin associated repeat
MSGRWLPIALMLVPLPARAEGNFALIEQVGTANRALVDQTGSGGSADVRQ